MFWLVGYNLAYGIDPGGYIGKFIPWADGSKIDTGYADGSDWYFQMVFCVTTVSIVSGTLAERINYGRSFYLRHFSWNFISNSNGLAMGRWLVSCSWFLRFCWLYIGTLNWWCSSTSRSDNFRPEAWSIYKKVKRLHLSLLQHHQSH